MSTSTLESEAQWFAIQTYSNQELKAKRYLDKFIPIEEMEDYVFDVLVPTETVIDVKAGKKTQKTRKFYPGYVFIKVRLFEAPGKVFQKPWYFIRGAQGIINFVGGENPVPLKKSEIERIINQVEEAEGKEVPSIQFEVGEEVKINDGPFMNLTGSIDEIDTDRGKLKVSVSIFGRLTPVELEFWQVERFEES